MTSSYTEITFISVSAEQIDTLIALLAEAGYEGFEEREQSLLAYLPTKQFDPAELAQIVEAFTISYTAKEIQSTNWNAQWESNFEPVTIGSFLHIRASFHPPNLNTQHEIVITPKMSFGTGHHATTQLMVAEMSRLNLQDQEVFDFGTGTGILAIVAAKLGARRVVAIDNDPWSIENAIENMEANSCDQIKIELAHQPPQSDSFDCIVANINLNVLVDYMSDLVRLLRKGGHLLLSGLLISDRALIEPVCTSSGLRVVSVKEQGDWMMLRLAY
jgi:ribosomal protein L11 methyltransferase